MTSATEASSKTLHDTERKIIVAKNPKNLSGYYYIVYILIYLHTTIYYKVRIVLSFFPVSINLSIVIKCSRVTLTLYLLSRHTGYLDIPVCFQDFCIMKTIQLLLYSVLYLEHVSKRILLPLPHI